MRLNERGHGETSPDQASEAEASRSATAPRVPGFPSIYRDYFDFVWSVARRLGTPHESIDDLVQEVFIVIHAKLDTLERPEALRSWIYSIVRRTVSSQRRAKRANANLGIAAPLVDVVSREPTPLEHTEKHAGLELLARLMDELDEPKREVFALVELEELSIPEVAEALDIPLNTAYSRLRAARQAFEAALARHEAREKGR
jgi:RNA polymerase sigma-70 factor (ECF subfamily)